MDVRGGTSFPAKNRIEQGVERLEKGRGDLFLKILRWVGSSLKDIN